MSSEQFYGEMWLPMQDEPLAVCHRCGALVHPEMTSEHTAHHEREQVAPQADDV